MTTHRPAEILTIEGPDAIAFAHAQFGSKVLSLGIGQWQFSAWLTPQGRVRALFHLARLADDRLLVLLRGGDATGIADALRRFVFRSKVTIDRAPPHMLASGAAAPMHAVHEDAGTISLGCETHSLRIVASGEADDAWHPLQLAMGWPWLPSALQDALLPSSLSLHRLQAVAVDKGCYPGQEIVARMHFRGGQKRHLHRVTLSQAANPGDVLHSDDREVGCVVDVVQSDDTIDALVILGDDLAAQAGTGRPCMLDGPLSVGITTSWTA